MEQREPLDQAIAALDTRAGDARRTRRPAAQRDLQARERRARRRDRPPSRPNAGQPAAGVTPSYVADYERRRERRPGRRRGPPRRVRPARAVTSRSRSTEVDRHPPDQPTARSPTATTAAASSCREPRRGGPDLLRRGLRGNPGPAAIGARGPRPGDRPADSARDGQRAHRGGHQQRRRVPGRHRRRSRRRRPTRARAVRVRCRFDARDPPAAGRVAGQASPPAPPASSRPGRCSPAYDVVDLDHVPREENTDADLLVNAALDQG